VERKEGGLDMGRRKYTDEQVINILREGETGAKIAELCCPSAEGQCKRCHLSPLESEVRWTNLE